MSDNVAHKPSPPGSAGPDTQRGGGAGLALGTLGVMVVVCAVYWPALSAEAIGLDDITHVLENPLVQNPGWESVRRLFAEVLEPSTGGYYKPLSMTSLMIDRWVAGPGNSLRPFHPVSLALHAANTALVILLLHLLFRATWPCVFVGLLFGVHPLMAESIPWAAERKSLLSAFFALVCIVLYVRYTRRGGRWGYWLAVLAFIPALLSKPTVTPLPVLLLVLDYWPLRRLRWRSVVEKLPFFALTLAAVIVTLISQSEAGSITVGGERTLLPQTPWRIPLTVCHNLAFYLHKLVWPADLSSYYPYPQPFDLSDPSLLAGVVGTGLAAVGLLVSLRWTRAVAAGGAFYFVALSPALGVVGFTNTIAADRFMYLPSIGWLCVAAWGLCRLWQGGAQGPALLESSGTRWRRAAICAAVALLALAESLATRAYLRDWADSERYYGRMIRLAPHTAPPRKWLGSLLYRGASEARRAGQPELAQDLVERAIRHLRESIRIQPGYFDARLHLGRALTLSGRHDAAIVEFRRMLQAKPANLATREALGKALLAKGDLAAALAEFLAVLEKQPDNGDVHNVAGVALQQLGDSDGAQRHFEAAVRYAPSFTYARLNLAQSYRLAGRTRDAVRELRALLRIDPDHEQAKALLTQLERASP